MKRLIVVLLVFGGCSSCTVGPFGTQEDDSPLDVRASNGTADTAPLFSWEPIDAMSLWVTDETERVVWGIEAGGRSLPEGRYERVLLSSPIPYGAFTDRTGETEETPRITTPPSSLVPGTTYTVHVSHLGGGSGGFTGRRPIVRSGTATFTVAVRVDNGD